MEKMCARFRLSLCVFPLCSFPFYWLSVDLTRQLRSKCPKLGSMNPKFRGFYELGWEKYIFIFSNLELKFSISFCDGCRQQTTVVLAVPATLSPVEITDIFISCYSCCRNLKISLHSSLLTNYGCH